MKQQRRQLQRGGEGQEFLGGDQLPAASYFGKAKCAREAKKRGCCGSTELPIVVARRSWREISCRSWTPQSHNEKPVSSSLTRAVCILTLKSSSHQSRRKYLARNNSAQKPHLPSPRKFLILRMQFCSISMPKITSCWAITASALH